MFLISILSRFQQWRERRDAAAKLRAMTDHQLKDIGLSRSMIDASLAGQIKR